MKTLLSLCAAPLLLGALWQDPSQADKDKKAVVRAGTDYVEALYEVKPELIERSVHPNLKKYGFYRGSPSDAYRGMPMTYEQLVKLAGSWNKDGSQAGEDSVKTIEVLDLMDTTAVLKVSAVWGVDHMQLGKFDGQWKVLHILWQSHPED